MKQPSQITISVVFIILFLVLLANNYILNDTLDQYWKVFHDGIDRDIATFVTHAKENGMPVAQVKVIRQLAVDIKDDTGSYVMWSSSSIKSSLMWTGLLILIAMVSLLRERVSFKEVPAEQRKKRLIVLVITIVVVLAVGLIAAVVGH